MDFLQNFAFDQLWNLFIPVVLTWVVSKSPIVQKVFDAIVKYNGAKAQQQLAEKKQIDEAGYCVSSMRNKANRLEELFVTLVENGRNGGQA